MLDDVAVTAADPDTDGCGVRAPAVREEAVADHVVAGDLLVVFLGIRLADLDAAAAEVGERAALDAAALAGLSQFQRVGAGVGEGAVRERAVACAACGDGGDPI